VAEVRPELREHRSRTLTLIEGAETTTRTRVAQMNKPVLPNLDRTIREVQVEVTASEAADAG
jgi:hypothetical protein